LRIIERKRLKIKKERRINLRVKKPQRCCRFKNTAICNDLTAKLKTQRFKSSIKWYKEIIISAGYIDNVSIAIYELLRGYGN
jgi:hypothetical protein